MYEQSIPTLAYILIGITSLVITYSHLDNKEESKNISTNIQQDNSIITGGKIKHKKRTIRSRKNKIEII